MMIDYCAFFVERFWPPTVVCFMKYFAILLVSCFLLVPVFSQTKTQKKPNSTTAVQKKPTTKSTSATNKPRSTPSGTASKNKTAGKSTASVGKGKPNASKPAPGSSGSTSKKSTAKKPGQADKQNVAAKTGRSADKSGSSGSASSRASKQIASAATDLKKKKNPAAKAASTKSKQTDKTKQTEAADAVPDGKADYDAAMALSDADERTAALRKFVARFPGSPFQAAASAAITSAMVDTGNSALRNRDVKAAAAAFMQAAKDAPVPIPDELFTNSLVKLPISLYFRGETDSGVITARILEGKCGTNASQLAGLAEFYVSIENGSEAKRLAKAAVDLAPDKAAGHRMLGLAYRIDFQLEDAAAAYAKAVELEPESAVGLIGLAEMKRALGKPTESIDLYQRILAKDAASSPARTGLTLALFESGKRDEAETQMAAILNDNPGNLMLLAGAAYWYAAHDEGQKAVDTAIRAISADPRFIWSHIALARGYMALKRPLDAEKTLLAARRYGNFPTMDYEIASARLMAGLYREAAEVLAQSYSVKDGEITTKLGGRVQKTAPGLSELVSLERRASIAEPQSADNAESASELRALLAFWTGLNSETSESGSLGKAADEFVRGDDVMKTHRLLFAAKELLDRKKELPKVVELAKTATGTADAAVDIPTPSAAVMADELYESRRLAAIRDEYVNVPDVSRSTLLSILRGRIEDITGWALFQSDNTTESLVRLKRAVSVLPEDSVWWRTSTWRLGTVLESRGQDADALEAYMKSYRSGQPDAIKYSVIATVYKRVNGSTFGLEKIIGSNPSAPVGETTAQRSDPTALPAARTSVVPERTPDTAARSDPAPVPGSDANSGNTAVVSPSNSPTPEPSASPATPVASPTAARPESSPVEVKEGPKPTQSPAADTPPAKSESTAPARPDPTPEPSPSAADASQKQPAKEETEKPSPSPTPDSSAAKTEPTPEPVGTPVTPKIEPTPLPGATPEGSQPNHQNADNSGTPETVKPPTQDASQKADAADDTKGIPPAEITAIATPTKTIDNRALAASQAKKDLFPPVVITVPSPADNSKKSGETEKSGSPASDAKDTVNTDKTKDEAKKPDAVDDNGPGDAKVRPRIVPGAPSASTCPLVLSDESISLENNGGRLAVIVRAEDERDISALTAVSSSPSDIYVRLEPIEGVTGRSLYVVRSISTKQGVFQVTFAMPCGSKVLVVKVR